MINLHSLKFDQAGKLVLYYEKANDWRDNWFGSFFDDVEGFERKDSEFICQKIPEKSKVLDNIKSIIEAVEDKFGAEQLEISSDIQELLNEGKDEAKLFKVSLENGENIKQSVGELNPQLSKNFKRTLKPFQKMSVEHMIQVGNAANFSVPGSGKTTMTYAALSKSLEDKTIEKILVIGPTSSFVPWQQEYELCFGKPKSPAIIVSGGDFAKNFGQIGGLSDLFLMHFQTGMHIVDEILKFFAEWKTVLIIDESHHIKNPNLKRRWNTMALKISKGAKKRIVLSGTPMPKDELDLWNQITCLWPNSKPLDERYVYDHYVKKKKSFGMYQSTFNCLFTRVTKKQLGLPDWNFIPKDIPLKKVQREIYDVVAAKMLKDIKLNFSDRRMIQKKRRARLIRLLQVASNPALIHHMAGHFDIGNRIFAEQFGLPVEKDGSSLEILQEVDDLSLSDKIKNYEQLGEIPSKISFAADKAKEIMDKGEKVIIWSSFIKNMELFEEQVLADVNPIIVNGTITRSTDSGVEKWRDTQRNLPIPKSDKTREERIEEFKNDNDPRILIANAASLGESVSLHRNLQGKKVCSNAIYLDRNFNGAQFMQSVDRIHRIGVDEKPNYWLLIGENTIDGAIHKSLTNKWKNMLKILNDPLVKKLGLDAEAEKVSKAEIESIDSILVNHLNEYFS